MTPDNPSFLRPDPDAQFLTTELAFRASPKLAERAARAMLVLPSQRTDQQLADMAAWNELTRRIQSGSDS